MEGPSSDDETSRTEDDDAGQGFQDDDKVKQSERSPVASSPARASGQKVRVTAGDGSVAATTKTKRKADSGAPSDRKKAKIEKNKDRLDRWEEVRESFGHGNSKMVQGLVLYSLQMLCSGWSSYSLCCSDV